jgi:DNA primase
VSARTELRRSSGSGYMGLCPFHDERSPSFSVDAAKKVFHCFGCQASGDAFTFVMETEGLDFKGALEHLADRYKVTLELEDEDPAAAETRKRRERLLELLERTATYYVRQLWESAEAAKAREYLAGRGLNEATLREFRVGYAPSAWDTVLNASRRAGYGNRELYDAGLAQRSQATNRIYDRFRSQIMFPLADARGRVRGFAGRTMGEDSGERRRPKYVNSPESELFHKGKTLFAADLARGPAAKAQSVIAAEGYTDVIAMHQAGVRNTVAIMGTSLTEDQIGELARLAPEVRLALDADSAGQDAMLRAARVAAGRKPPLRLRVVGLPPGDDPADLVQREGAEAITRLVEAAVPFARFRVLRRLDTGDLASAEGRDRVLEALRDDFSLLAPSAEREELARIAASRLDLSAELLESLLARAPARRPDPAQDPGAGRPVAAPQLGRREPTERSFLAHCIALPKLGAPALEALDPQRDLASDVSRRAVAHLRGHLAAPAEGLDELYDAELAALVRELSVRATALADATPRDFEIERLQLDLARIGREIAAAPPGGGGIAALATKRGELMTRLHRLMEQV